MGRNRQFAKPAAPASNFDIYTFQTPLGRLVDRFHWVRLAKLVSPVRLGFALLFSPVGTRAVIGTVRLADMDGRPAKEVIGTRGIADRPAANLIAQLEQ